MFLFSIAMRYLGARKLRTILTTLAVVFGVAVIFAGNLVMPSALESFRRSTLGAAGLVDLNISARGGAFFDAAPVLERLQATSGVQHVTPVLQQQLSLPALPNGLVPHVVIVGVDPATIEQVRVLDIAEGRMLQPGDQGVVVVQQDTTDDANLKVGDGVTLPGVNGPQQYKVIGLQAERDIPSSDVLMTLGDAQTLLGTGPRVSSVEAALVPGTDREALTTNVLAQLGNDFQKGASSSIDAVGSLDIAYAMFNMMGGLALFIGAFIIFNTFQTIVLERKRDLAMLRAIGAERKQIVRLLLVESLLQGIIGSLLGLLVGAVFAILIGQAMNSISQELMGGAQLSISFNMLAVIPALLAGTITTLLAGYLPARAAGRVTPLEALRPTSVAARRRSGRLSLIVGLVLVVASIVMLLISPATTAGGAIIFLIGLAVLSPVLVVPMTRLFAPLLSPALRAETEIAQGNLNRQPSRAAITSSTLMVGLAVLVMLVSVMSSFEKFVIDLYQRNFASDILVLPQNIAIMGANLGASPQLASDLRAIPGVATVGTLRSSAATVKGQTTTIQGIDPASYPLVSALTFDQGDAQAAYTALLQERTTIVNGILASTLGLKTGDTIQVSSANGTYDYRIVAIGSDALNFKINTLFVSQDTLARDFGMSKDIVLMLKLAPSADMTATEAAVTQVAQKYSQFTVRNTASFREELTEQSLGVLRGAILPLALVILLPAMLGLLNTLTMNILERTREIGIVRAIGASQQQVRWIVMAEAVLVGLFGALFGVLAGAAMSYGFIQALAVRFGTQLPFTFPWVGMLGALLAGVLLTLLVSALPARNAARLDILRALRYE